MATERRKQVVLGVLVVILAVAAFRAYRAAPAAADMPALASNQRGTPSGTPARVDAPDVRLEALDAERPSPGSAERNLFEFGAAPPPPSLDPPTPRFVPPPAALPGPAAAPGTSPIPLKFIGVIQAPDPTGTIAVLSDARGVYHAKVGEAVEGKYRVLRIGAESIEIAHIDGRGRQIIRMGS